MKRVPLIILNAFTVLSLLLFVAALALRVCGNFVYAWVKDGVRWSFAVRGGDFIWSIVRHWPYDDPKPGWNPGVAPDVPLVNVMALAAILPANWIRKRVLRRLRQAAEPDRIPCPACGYDLRATPDRCPECGTVPDPSAHSAAQPLARR